MVKGFFAAIAYTQVNHHLSTAAADFIDRCSASSDIGLKQTPACVTMRLRAYLLLIFVSKVSIRHTKAMADSRKSVIMT